MANESLACLLRTPVHHGDVEAARIAPSHRDGVTALRFLANRQEIDLEGEVIVEAHRSARTLDILPVFSLQCARLPDEVPIARRPETGAAGGHLKGRIKD